MSAVRTLMLALPVALLACAAGVSDAGAAGDATAPAAAAKKAPAASKPAAKKPAPDVMPVPAPDPPSVLDLATLAARSRLIELSAGELRAALIKGKPEGVVFSSVLDLGGGAMAVAWAECTKAACKGQAATLSLSNSTLKVVKQVALVAPAKVHFVDGFSFEAPAFADLDGDGSAELIFHYSTVEPPRPALGSMLREHLVAYDPHTLGLVFSHELRKAGGDSEEACHWSIEQSGDRLIATGHCNKRACAEAASLPALCKPTKKRVETWRKAPGQKKYSKVAR